MKESTLMVNHFPHISRLVDLPADLAKEAFDAVAAGHAGGEGGGAWRVVVSSGRLDLARPEIVSASPRTYWPYRRVRGRLRPAGTWRGLAVELELLPWSDARTELGLALIRGPGPLTVGLNRPYLRVGGDVLEGLRLAMEDWLVALLWGFTTAAEDEFATPFL
jgi:hypothetical protein